MLQRYAPTSYKLKGTTGDSEIRDNTANVLSHQPEVKQITGKFKIIDNIAKVLSNQP
jgi:hypothetical protein